MTSTNKIFACIALGASTIQGLLLNILPDGRIVVQVDNTKFTGRRVGH